MGYLNMYLIAFFEERLSFHLRRNCIMCASGIFAFILHRAVLR
jgi:hypothetical protein